MESKSTLECGVALLCTGSESVACWNLLCIFTCYTTIQTTTTEALHPMHNLTRDSASSENSRHVSLTTKLR